MMDPATPTMNKDGDQYPVNMIQICIHVQFMILTIMYFSRTPTLKFFIQIMQTIGTAS